MFIKDILRLTKPSISFEIFPPKKDSPIETVFNTIDELEHLRPNFMSVTYGAGGSSKDRTVEIASLIKNEHKIESLAHLTCITSTKDEIHQILDNLNTHNIKNIMALRGDVPKDYDPTFKPYFSYAKDLISYIKTSTDFCVGGACYPEGHTDCKDISKCTEYLKEKVYVGVDFLVTQLFLDNSYFYDFYDQTKRFGINIPILAGIMPVTNVKQVERMISLCGVNIPNKLKEIVDRYENSPDSFENAGIEYATEQILDLISWGVDGIHLYTMNKPETAKTIMNNIQLNK